MGKVIGTGPKSERFSNHTIDSYRIWTWIFFILWFLPYSILQLWHVSVILIRPNFFPSKNLVKYWIKGIFSWIMCLLINTVVRRVKVTSFYKQEFTTFIFIQFTLVNGLLIPILTEAIIFHDIYLYLLLSFSNDIFMFCVSFFQKLIHHLIHFLLWDS